MRERFAPCPPSPNCVSSYAGDEEHHVDPLPLPADRPEATDADILEALRRVLSALPRTRIVNVEGDYLHATCTSLVFRFVDDVEFRLDREAGVMHVRSASRVGYGDLGVNRRRVEKIRALLRAERDVSC